MAANLAVVSAPHFARQVTLDPTSVPASSVQKETFTVTGIRLASPLIVNMPTDETGLVLLGSRVTAKDTIELTFWNYTGDAIDVASSTFFVYQP